METLNHPNCFAVRRVWQLAHTTSHLAISVTTLDQHILNGTKSWSRRGDSNSPTSSLRRRRSTELSYDGMAAPSDVATGASGGSILAWGTRLRADSAIPARSGIRLPLANLLALHGRRSLRLPAYVLG